MKKSEATRLTILEKAFELIYANGYQTTSVDDIIATTKVTKGAFYYHFKNKDDMGLSIVNELMKPTLTAGFVEPLQTDSDPLKIIYHLLYSLLMENDILKVAYGCPASNLTHEMTPWHPDFSKALDDVTQRWIKAMAESLERGKLNGFVRSDVESMQVTMFIMSGYWGIRNFGKLANSKNAYLLFLNELKNYLEMLR